MSRKEFKQLVKASRMEDERLSQTYERLARDFGFKDWNTMSALYLWREDND